MRYQRILAEVAGLPWAIEPAKGQAIAAFLTRKANGETIPEPEVAAAVAQKRPKAKARAGEVAVIGMYGVMVQRADVFAEISGAVSTEAVGRMLDDAAADPGVTAVVLDIDSPGGSVHGTAELGAKVAALAKSKKVTAVANATAASGAYWVASQASELVVTPSGWVGSIGCYQMHVDRSEELRAAGVAVTLISAGERKTAGNEYAPLDAAGREEIAGWVQGYYDQFVRAVAAGRKVSMTRVREGFGRGGMVLAEAAVKEGMADRVGTLDDVLGRYGLSAADVTPAAALQPDRFGLENRRRRLALG